MLVQLVSTNHTENMEEYSEQLEKNAFCTVNNTLNKLNACLFSSFEQRLATFQNWPHKRPTAASMAEAGFYFSKIEDRVICFHCGEILSMWTPNDNPYIEHAFWYPHCLFIRTMVGEIVMKKVEQLSHTCDSQSRSNLYNSLVTTCNMCFKNTVDVVLFPCKHTRYCQDCIQTTKTIKCPFCAEYISFLVEINM